jgi:hypothetical protein
MSGAPRFVLDLVHGIAALEQSLAEAEAEWRPEPAPITCLMGAAGRAFAEHSDVFSSAEITIVFERLETIFRDGEQAEKDAAATGFLEAVASVLDRAPERRWILEHAGSEARHYLVEWDRFCGIV